MTDRTVSPMGDQRSHSVLCRRCLTMRTMNIDAICDNCHQGRCPQCNEGGYVEGLNYGTDRGDLKMCPTCGGDGLLS